MPEVEALHVKLKALVVRLADSLHEELVARDQFPARIAYLVIARATPNTRNAVRGETAISKLAADEKAERFVVHVGLGVVRGYSEKRPDSPES